MQDADLMPLLLGGRYLVGAVLGRGGMAVVYRAWDSVLNRDVAVKVLSGLVVEPAARARFEAEGQILAELNHPGLTMLHDAGTEDDRPYLVMELVEGTTLTDLYQRQFLDPVEVATIGAALGDALAYVHARGIAHRDVKPSNVLIDHDRRVRLADFGIARLLDNATRHTATGLIMGTAAYLPPEQVRGEPASRAGDVYALSLVLLEALGGGPVYAGAPHIVALARLVRPPQIEATLPAPLREVLTAMSADQPADRPTAAEVAARLRDIIRELTVGRSAAVAPPALTRRPSAHAASGPADQVECGTGAATQEPVTNEPVTTGSLVSTPVTKVNGAGRRGLVWAGAGIAVTALSGVLLVSGSLIFGDMHPSLSTRAAGSPASAASRELSPPVSARARPDTSSRSGPSATAAAASARAAPGSGTGLRPAGAQSRGLAPSTVTTVAVTAPTTSPTVQGPKKPKKPKPKKPKPQKR